MCSFGTTELELKLKHKMHSIHYELHITRVILAQHLIMEIIIRSSTSKMYNRLLIIPI